MAYTLPKTFVLKSSYNNKYLAYVREEGEVHGLLKFTADSVNELTVFEVEPANTGNGFVHVKCCYNNKYWRRWSPSHYWIAAQADEPEEDQSKWSCTLFKPHSVDAGAKTIMLTHIQLGHFACSWRAGEPYTYGLFAAVTTPDNDKLDVFNITELVPVSRELTDVQFSLNDAKFSGQTTVTLGRAVAVNNGSDSSEVKTVTIEYTKEESRSWKGNRSLNSEIETDIRSAIPMVVNERTLLSGNEFAGPYQMGKTMLSTDTVKTTYDIVVPPRTMVIVTLKATKASFEVPFTYTRRDTFTDKNVLTFNHTDGSYTGITLFDLRYEAEKKPRS